MIRILKLKKSKSKRIIEWVLDEWLVSWYISTRMLYIRFRTNIHYSKQSMQIRRRLRTDSLDRWYRSAVFFGLTSRILDSDHRTYCAMAIVKLRLKSRIKDINTARTKFSNGHPNCIHRSTAFFTNKRIGHRKSHNNYQQSEQEHYLTGQRTMQIL